MKLLPVSDRLHSITRLFAVILFSCTLLPISQALEVESETPAERDARMAWWKEARFGMFIHWGVYSVLGGTYKGEAIDGIGEWIMHRAHIPVEEYETYASMWNPQFFDADEWVSLAAEAGVRYIVITSKHHDGFALWDSAVTDWDVMDASPFKRDILMEMASACTRHGIRLCFYHSIMDWHHPDAQAPNYPEYNNTKTPNPRFPDYVEHYLKPQLTELLTKYGDIGVLWFDGEWISDYTSAMAREIYRHVREQQPGIIINNRVDKGRKGMSGLDKAGDYVGDFGTPEQEIPDQGFPGVDWESCMTMNDTWGWKPGDQNWKSSTRLIHNLIESVSKGGNYLLNVGPTHEGVIPAPSVERLREIGAWLKLNGESIYGAQASPFEKPSWGRYTITNDALYAHILDWPTDKLIYIPKMKDEKVLHQASLLATGEALRTDPGEAGMIVFLPDEAPDPNATVLKLEW